VILDGYHQAAQAYTDRLMSLTPFRNMLDSFNVYRVDVISEQPIIDVPQTCGDYNYADPPGTALDQYAREPGDRVTALSTTWCPATWPIYRYIDSTDLPAVWNHANTAGVFPHLVVVLVNDWMSGATAWANAFLPNGSGGVAFVSMRANLHGEKNAMTQQVIQPMEPAMYPDVATHETAHLGPFLLRDEYGNGTGSVSPADQVLIDGSPNLTTSLTPPLKWRLLQTPGSVMPTDCAVSPLPDAAAAPGGNGYASGVYHPRCSCRMKVFTTETFCVVCRQRILDVLATGAGPPLGASTFRLILDSFRLKTLAEGEYVLDFSATDGPTTATGRWPKSGSEMVVAGQTEEPGYSILDIALGASAASFVDVRYTIFGRDNTGGLFPIEANTVSIAVPMTGRGTVRQFDLASHRITFGVARR
jgi:hypothetical protein